MSVTMITTNSDTHSVHLHCKFTFWFQMMVNDITLKKKNWPNLTVVTGIYIVPECSSNKKALWQFSHSSI